MIESESIRAFIARQKVAFIASVDGEGFPNMKAMLMPRKIEGNDFYFTTNTSSNRVAQYRQNPKASIYFYHMGIVRYEGVMLLGTMEVLEEASIKREIWRSGDQMFYPKGLDDPDYCVLKFTAAKGRHYCDLKTESFSL